LACPFIVYLLFGLTSFSTTSFTVSVSFGLVFLFVSPLTFPSSVLLFKVFLTVVLGAVFFAVAFFVAVFLAGVLDNLSKKFLSVSVSPNAVIMPSV